LGTSIEDAGLLVKWLWDFYLLYGNQLVNVVPFGPALIATNRLPRNAALNVKAVGFDHGMLAVGTEVGVLDVTLQGFLRATPDLSSVGLGM
jgi:hypothetical protein